MRGFTVKNSRASSVSAQLLPWQCDNPKRLKFYDMTEFNELNFITVLS